MVCDPIANFTSEQVRIRDRDESVDASLGEDTVDRCTADVDRVCLAQLFGDTVGTQLCWRRSCSMTSRVASLYWFRLDVGAEGRSTRLENMVRPVAICAVPGLSGRWMPDKRRTHTQYLDEQNWPPIVFTASNSENDHDIPLGLCERGLEPRPAVEGYL
jgi:hypothetical protein